MLGRLRVKIFIQKITNRLKVGTLKVKWLKELE